MQYAFVILLRSAAKKASATETVFPFAMRILSYSSVISEKKKKFIQSVKRMLKESLKYFLFKRNNVIYKYKFTFFGINFVTLQHI